MRNEGRRTERRAEKEEKRGQVRRGGRCSWFDGGRVASKPPVCAVIGSRDGVGVAKLMGRRWRSGGRCLNVAVDDEGEYRSMCLKSGGDIKAYSFEQVRECRQGAAGATGKRGADGEGGWLRGGSGRRSRGAEQGKGLTGWMSC